MRRALFIAFLAVLLGMGMYFVCYRARTRPMRQMAAQPSGEMQWLAKEFKLSPGQSERIAQLHRDYEPRCAQACQKIAENSAQLDRLISAGHERTPEMDALLRQSADIQAECRRDMLTHIYAVAAAMPPQQAKRYLALMKRQVLQPGAPHAFIAWTHEQ